MCVCVSSCGKIISEDCEVDEAQSGHATFTIPSGTTQPLLMQGVRGQEEACTSFQRPEMVLRGPSVTGPSVKRANGKFHAIALRFWISLITIFKI